MIRIASLYVAFFFSLLIASSAAAQEGIVTYEEVVQLNIELPPEMAHMAANFPRSQSTTKQLFFNETAAIFKNASTEQTEDVEEHNHDGAMIRFQMRREEEESFFNFEENLRTEKREFMGRTFLIDSEASTLPWRLTNERSEFLGYTCQKAVATMDSTRYEAWFTPEISIPAGPGEGGLPGLILVMNVNDGKRSYVAKELTLQPVEEGLIAAPDKGKRVTQEEFDEIVAEKMKEMNATSSGGNFVIRMRN